MHGSHMHRCVIQSFYYVKSVGTQLKQTTHCVYYSSVQCSVAVQLNEVYVVRAVNVGSLHGRVDGSQCRSYTLPSGHRDTLTIECLIC